MDGEPVDIGLVGDIVATDPGLVRGLIADGRIPVLSSVARGADGDGVVYNVNADTAAAALAVALGAAKLVVLTDVAGLYTDWPGRDRGDQPARRQRPGQAAAGAVGRHDPEDGSLPRAVRGGVPQAHVLDGRLQHAILLEIFTDSGIGTMVLPTGRTTAGATPKERPT